MLKKVFYQFLIFIIGAVGYPCIELMYRAGNCHWIMTIIGGLALMMVIDVNILLRKYNIFFRTFIACLGITFIEFISGLIVNKWLQWKVWDYSYLDYNFEGQICLEFSFYWLLLSFVVIIMYELIYWLYRKYFKKEKKCAYLLTNQEV